MSQKLYVVTHYINNLIKNININFTVCFTLLKIYTVCMQLQKDHKIIKIEKKIDILLITK